jgi:hypothetical protein
LVGKTAKKVKSNWEDRRMAAKFSQETKQKGKHNLEDKLWTAYLFLETGHIDEKVEKTGSRLRICSKKRPKK